jgi:hypothetical protein
MTHLISRAGAIALGFATLAVLSVIWAMDGRTIEADHAPGMTAISVDTNISGNDADSLGPNNTCVSTPAGSSITVDVTALEIPSTARMLAFGYALAYDPNFFSVTDADAHFLLEALPGSSVLVGSEIPPDADGSFAGSAADININAAEYGSGILERLTLAIDGGTPPGTYPLTLTNGAHGDVNNHWYTAEGFNNAIVAVDQACPTGAGDVDCSNTVNSIDALKILRHNASLSVVQNEPCTNIGQNLGSRDQGDVDCNNSVNAVDALKVLRGVAGLPVQQEPGCPPVT